MGYNLDISWVIGKKDTSSLNNRRFHETGEKVVSKIDSVDKLSLSFGSITLDMSDSLKLKRNQIEEFLCSNDLDAYDEINEIRSL